jgi:hypothetical protein
MTEQHQDSARVRRVFLGEHAALLENLSTSLRLACERGSDEAAGVLLRQLREVLVEAIALFKQAAAE